MTRSPQNNRRSQHEPTQEYRNPGAVVLALADRPGLLEKFGVAVNAQDLSPTEGAVDRIGALAYAQINPGAIEHESEDQVTIDPRSELGAVLIRLKAGGQFQEGVRAVELLVQFIHHQRAYARWKLRDGNDLLHRFAHQALAEWLYDVCPACRGATWRGTELDVMVTRRLKCHACHGSGRQVTDTGARLCPNCNAMGKRFLSVVRPVTPRECADCSGTGRRLANDSERSRALGVEFRVYQKHWLKRFSWIESRLGILIGQEKKLLRTAEK